MLHVLDDLNSFLSTSIFAEETDKMFNGFKIARSKLDGATPLLFSLVPPPQRKEGCREIRDGLNIAANI